MYPDSYFNEGIQNNALQKVRIGVISISTQHPEKYLLFQKMTLMVNLSSTTTKSRYYSLDFFQPFYQGLKKISLHDRVFSTFCIFSRIRWMKGNKRGQKEE